MNSIETARKNVQKWLGKGRYLKFDGLRPTDKIVGAVVHDGIDAIDRALKFPPKRNIETRFETRVFRLGNRCVLLIETGMGCTGQSIIAYELALQGYQVPIIKIGTCVSVRRAKQETGIIFVPRWAVADEGVSTWDKRIHSKLRLPALVEEVFRNKTVARASETLHSKWSNHLMRQQSVRKKLAGRLVDYETAVWSSDAFYPLMLRPDFFRHLGKGTLIRVNESERRVTEISRQENKGKWTRLMAWDMECSALFSAGETMKMEVAAALVISYSNKQSCDIGYRGEDGRSSDEKEKVHAIEDVLIGEAIRYLLCRDVR